MREAATTTAATMRCVDILAVFWLILTATPAATAAPTTPPRLPPFFAYCLWLPAAGAVTLRRFCICPLISFA